MTEESEDKFTVRSMLILASKDFVTIKHWIEHDGYWIDSAQPLQGGIFYVCIKKVPDNVEWK